MRQVSGLNFDFSSPSVISSGLLTSPSTAIFHVSGSLASSGIWPLLRMKNLPIGVVSSSSRFCRRLGHQRPVAEHHELVVLAGEFQILRTLRRGGRRGAARRALRHRRRDQPARHIGGERNGAAHRGAHGGEARAAEKAAAVDAGLAAEHFGVGALGIVRVQFVERSFDFPGIVASLFVQLSIVRGLFCAGSAGSSWIQDRECYPAWCRNGMRLGCFLVVQCKATL